MVSKLQIIAGWLKMLFHEFPLCLESPECVCASRTEISRLSVGLSACQSAAQCQMSRSISHLLGHI